MLSPTEAHRSKSQGTIEAQSGHLNPGSSPPLRGRRQPLLTVREVALHLGVSNAIVYRLVNSGAIAHMRIANAVRIRPAALDAFLTEAEGQS